MNIEDEEKIKDFISTRINNEFFNLSSENIKNIKRKNKISDELLSTIITEVIINNKISFPIHREWMKDPFELFNNLKKYKYDNNLIIDIPYKINKSNFFKTNIIDNKFNDRYLFFFSPDSDFQPINRLTYYFQDQVIIECKRFNFNYTPKFLWSNYNLLNSIVFENLKSGLSITKKNLREFIFSTGVECGLFKLTIAKGVYKFFESKKILDFSSGWGDRLISAISLEKDIDYYHGVDPNIKLFDNYEKIIKKFSKMPEKFTMINSPFENVELTCNYDLIFTSPPFFILEDFVHDQRDGDKECLDQSIDLFPNLNSWIINFLFFSLFKAWNNLLEEGFMVINIEDVLDFKTNQKFFYTEPMVLFANIYLENSQFIGVIANLKSLKNKNKGRPLYVWKKGNFEQNKQIDESRELFRTNYKEIYNLTEKFFGDKEKVNFSGIELDKKFIVINSTIKVPKPNPLPENLAKIGNKGETFTPILFINSENINNKISQKKLVVDFNSKESFFKLKKISEINKNLTKEKVSTVILEILNKKDILNELVNQEIKFNKKLNKNELVKILHENLEKNEYNIEFTDPLKNVIKRNKKIINPDNIVGINIPTIDFEF